MNSNFHPIGTWYIIISIHIDASVQKAKMENSTLSIVILALVVYRWFPVTENKLLILVDSRTDDVTKLRSINSLISAFKIETSINTYWKEHPRENDKKVSCYYNTTNSNGHNMIRSCDKLVWMIIHIFLSVEPSISSEKRIYQWSRKTSSLPRLHQRLSICQRYLRFPIYISRGIEKFKECKIISSWKNHRSVFLHTKSYVELTRRGWFERNGGIWYVMQFFL